MPKFKLSTIERWEHKVYYEPVKAESLQAAWEAVKAGEVSYDESEILEAGDEVLYLNHAQQDGVQVEIPPEIPTSYPVPVIPPEINERERFTLLTALQHLRRTHQYTPDGQGFNTHNGLLSIEEVDLLCERLAVDHLVREQD